jgi:hypothetical protein
MGEADADVARGECAAKGAGGVTLHHEQFRRLHRKKPSQRRLNKFGVKQWIGLSGAAQRYRVKFCQPMIGQFQPWMLAGHEQPRQLAKLGERPGDRT